MTKKKQNFSFFIIQNIIPTFVHVALTLKGLIEDKLNKGETKINLIPYFSKATLDIIGLVGKGKKNPFVF